MRNASGDNYRNSSCIVDEAMGQIPHSTERISSLNLRFAHFKYLAINTAVYSDKRDVEQRILIVFSVTPAHLLHEPYFIDNSKKK